jgi:transposase
MLIVETIARIRREHFIKGKTIKEIARDLKVSRNTVRKVLRSGKTLFEYERSIQPRPKLGRWAAELDELLAANAAKSAREQLTLIRIFEELRGRGYDGGYDAVRRYARRWSKERGQSTAAAYVPLSFAPGEAYQFDWSHEIVLLNGVTMLVKVAHVRLCHSRMLFARAYPRETQEMVFDAHDRAFTLFKGTCSRGGVCSKPSAPSSFPMPVGLTASTRCRHRSPRPAWYASTTTSTRSRPAPSGARSKFKPMPIAS